jgi:hypothetical protein
MLPGINSDLLEPHTSPSTLVPQIIATANHLKAIHRIKFLPEHTHPLNTHVSET